MSEVNCCTSPVCMVAWLQKQVWLVDTTIYIQTDESTQSVSKTLTYSPSRHIEYPGLSTMGLQTVAHTTVCSPYSWQIRFPQNGLGAYGIQDPMGTQRVQKVQLLGTFG